MSKNTWWMTAARWMALCVAMVLGSACSAPDSDDMDALVDKINNLPENVMADLKVWAANKKILKYLRKQNKGPGEVIVADVKCAVWIDGKEQPSDGQPETTIPLHDLLDFMDILPLSYRDVVEMMADSIAAEIRDAAQKMAPGLGGADLKIDVKCVPVYRTGFAPDDVAAIATGKTHYSAGEFDIRWQAIDAYQIGEALLESPLPPPGLPAGTLRILLPALCALSVEWGCPDSPNNPDAPITGPGAPPPGDHAQ